MDQKTQFDRALTMLRSGDYRAVADLCVDSLERFPGDANFLVLSARANLALKEFDTAEKNVQEALRLFPDFAEAHETLGDLMLFRGNAGGARSAYETASRLDPSRTHARDKIRRARELEKAAAAKPAKETIPFESELAAAAQHEKAGDLQAAEMISASRNCFWPAAMLASRRAASTCRGSRLRISR